MQETVGGGAGGFFSLNADFELSLWLRPTMTLRRGGEQIVRLEILVFAQYLSRRRAGGEARKSGKGGKGDEKVERGGGRRGREEGGNGGEKRPGGRR